MKPTDLGVLLGDSLFRLLQPFRKRMGDEIRRAGFTSSQFWVLHWVNVYAPTTPGRISKILNVSLPSITSNLNQLEQEGYLIRSRGPSDRRQVLITPTEKGRRVSRILQEFSRVIGVQASRDFSAKDRATSVRLLAAMVDRLEADLRSQEARE